MFLEDIYREHCKNLGKGFRDPSIKLPGRDSFDNTPGRQSSGKSTGL